MALDMTSFDSALKQHYTRDNIERLVYPNNAFLGLLPKYEKFGGKNLPINVIYGATTGRSATFATAQANKDYTKLNDFILVRSKDYSLASVDNETLEASKGDGNSFLEAATVEIDSAIQAATRSLATALFRDGSGAIGRINSTVSGTTLTLSEPNDIVNFEVGQKIQFSSAATSATLRASGATLTVTAVDRGAGSMTVSANLNTITSLTASDYINVQGDIEAKLKGLDAWLPASAPTSTAFYSMDRSVDPTRLGGVRYDGSALPIEEALIEGMNLVAREGGRPDYCFMSFKQYSNLLKALGSKVQYIDVKGSAQVSFPGIQLASPSGAIKVVPDQNCLVDTAFLLQMNTWKLYSLGMAPKIIDSDGQKWLRESSADSIEIRTGYYGALGCRAPGFNARVTLAS